VRKPILVPALLLVLTSSFGQNTNSGPSGGKTNEVKTAPSEKKSAPKPTSNQDKPLYSPCGVYYKDREDMIGQSNLVISGSLWANQPVSISGITHTRQPVMQKPACSKPG